MHHPHFKRFNFDFISILGIELVNLSLNILLPSLRLLDDINKTWDWPFKGSVVKIRNVA